MKWGACLSFYPCLCDFVGIVSSTARVELTTVIEIGMGKGDGNSECKWIEWICYGCWYCC